MDRLGVGQMTQNFQKSSAAVIKKKGLLLIKTLSFYCLTWLVTMQETCSTQTKIKITLEHVAKKPKSRKWKDNVGRIKTEQAKVAQLFLSSGNRRCGGGFLHQSGLLPLLTLFQQEEKIIPW